MEGGVLEDSPVSYCGGGEVTGLPPTSEPLLLPTVFHASPKGVCLKLGFG